VTETAATETVTVQASFTIKRRFAAKPERVFQAFADPATKARWFHGPLSWQETERRQDFRVGGIEFLSGGPPGKPAHSFNCLYQNIVPNRRLIYSYDMKMGDTPISVSLAIIELVPDGNGTVLTITEHGAFLDGFDAVENREQGTRALLEQMAEVVEA
jgi:uncharacterized protein YndB with AHSA1/START domain